MEEVYKPFPQEPLKQLEEAIEAVFKSWDMTVHEFIVI